MELYWIEANKPWFLIDWGHMLV